jgi:hypothetical protein
VGSYDDELGLDKFDHFLSLIQPLDQSSQFADYFDATQARHMHVEQH